MSRVSDSLTASRHARRSQACLHGNVPVQDLRRSGRALWRRRFSQNMRGGARRAFRPVGRADLLSPMLRAANSSLPMLLTIGPSNNSRPISITTSTSWSIPTIGRRGRAPMPTSWRDCGASTRRRRASRLRRRQRYVLRRASRARLSVALSYDPMVPQYAQRPEGKFDLVTCFETMEHLPDPNAGISSLLEFAADPGFIFFTTLVQSPDFEQMGHELVVCRPAQWPRLDFLREALMADLRPTRLQIGLLQR